MNRGRPIENDTVILKYTQHFKEYTGESFIWEWDKEINSKGPLSVTINDPFFNKNEKNTNEYFNLLEKKKNTKIEKIRLIELKKEIDQFHHFLFPEDFTSNKKLRKRCQD